LCFFNVCDSSIGRSTYSCANGTTQFDDFAAAALELRRAAVTFNVARVKPIRTPKMRRAPVDYFYGRFLMVLATVWTTVHCNVDSSATGEILRQCILIPSSRACTFWRSQVWKAVSSFVSSSSARVKYVDQHNAGS
jgi:hypothetical protein